MELSEWHIAENRIDIYSTTHDQQVFVGFRNAGFVASDTPTPNYFQDKASKLIRCLFKLEGFGNLIVVERIRVRSRFCTPFNGKFEKLCERYETGFLTLAKEAREVLGDTCRLIDIGGPLNFVDSIGNFNTMSGPMARTQLITFFKKEIGFPEVGLFVDIDYWRRPEKDMGGNEVIAVVKSFAEAAWARHEQIRKLVMGG